MRKTLGEGIFSDNVNATHGISGGSKPKPGQGDGRVDRVFQGNHLATKRVLLVQV